MFPASTFYCDTLVSPTCRQELYHICKWLQSHSQRVSPNGQIISLNILPTKPSTLTKSSLTTLGRPQLLVLFNEYDVLPKHSATNQTTLRVSATTFLICSN